MSELINNRQQRMELLKSLIMKMNDGARPELVREEVSTLLKKVPYEDVISVEQELFSQGVDKDNMLELCDLHSAALNGLITPAIKKESQGHPVDTFKKENQAIKREISFIRKSINELSKLKDEENAGELFIKLHTNFNALMDIEKHFLRKENILFPFLEKHQITGPSTVMWGKDDQIREALKTANAVLGHSHEATAGEGKAIAESILLPAIQAIEEMSIKEEQILFPMSLDTLQEDEWYEVYRQSDEIGYCLYAPTGQWRPEGIEIEANEFLTDSAKVHLPTGAFKLSELASMLNIMPFDFTFVDKNDYVRYFSEGRERIFQRNKAILGRKVQFCHPPSSVHTVEKILADFKAGRQDKAEFWINMQGRFIYISYFAVRGENSEYIGTLEVTQDLTALRKLEGERRILSYESQEINNGEPKVEKLNSNSDNSTEEKLPGYENVVLEYDARKDLEKGIHPVGKVMSDLDSLNGSEKYLLITPFTPIPLIDKAKVKGFKADSYKVDENKHATYFYK